MVGNTTTRQKYLGCYGPSMGLAHNETQVAKGESKLYQRRLGHVDYERWARIAIP